MNKFPPNDSPIVGNDYSALLGPEGLNSLSIVGAHLGNLPFVEEEHVAMNSSVGGELDGRLYTDLSELPFGNTVTPNERFYVRTRVSQLYDASKFNSILIQNHRSTLSLRLEDILRNARPQGMHLMECAGNRSRGHFGLISVADWSGVSICSVLDQVGETKYERRTRLLISGFDTYAGHSVTSIPGASWVFTHEQLRDTKAFLAVAMNGKPLNLDHGAPVRLMIPGWYGCACIKWINEITFVDDAAEATSQMREYASRTHQNGVPKLARDYRPPAIEPAAMPVRVEKWLIANQIIYRVVGILWGGSTPLKFLNIRFVPDTTPVPVHRLQPARGDMWRFWTHFWHPEDPGMYEIRLNLDDPGIKTRRLDVGYYMRKVHIEEV